MAFLFHAPATEMETRAIIGEAEGFVGAESRHYFSILNISGQTLNEGLASCSAKTLLSNGMRQIGKQSHVLIVRDSRTGCPTTHALHITTQQK